MITITHSGLPSAPTDILANFTKRKIYMQWIPADKHNGIEPIAYHVNTTPVSVDPIQTPSPVSIPGNYTQCILYEVCVKEETLAGIGHSGCINTNSNISGKGHIHWKLIQGILSFAYTRISLVVCACTINWEIVELNVVEFKTFPKKILYSPSRLWKFSHKIIYQVCYKISFFLNITCGYICI